MNNMLKLMLPLGLGVIAGGLNYLALQQKTYDYISIKEPLLAGDQFPSEDSKFSTFTVNAVIPGGIRWEDRGVLHKATVPQNLEAGDILLLRDIADVAQQLELGPKEVAINISLDGIRFEPRLMKVGAQVGFAVPSSRFSKSAAGTTLSAAEVGMSYEVLGPFRVVSLGERVRDTSRYNDDSSKSTPVTTISVARTLNEGGLLDDASSRLIEANRTQGIGAAVLYPDPKH